MFQMSSLSFQECVSDTDDHTCLEDYHECIEEYQECLEVMHICLDDSQRSYACTPCDSHEDIREEFPTRQKQTNDSINNVPQTEHFTAENTVKQSGADKYSASDCVKKITSIVDSIYDKQFSNLKSGSPKTVSIQETRQSSKVKPISVVNVPDDSDREGYETCQEDLFSSESSKLKMNNTSNGNLNDDHSFLENNIDSCVSEPCIRKKIFSKRNHVCLESKVDDIDLKSYDDQNNSFGADQFFLVDYIDDDVSEELQPEVPDKWISEPNVTEERTISRRFRKFLREYYNDYADCLEEYRKYSDVPNEPPEVTVDKSSETLVNDDNQCDLELMSFENVFLPVKSNSTPGLLDLLGVENQLDSFLDKNRRKSACVPGYPEDRYVLIFLT